MSTRSPARELAGGEAVASGGATGGAAISAWTQEVAALTRRWYIQLTRARLNLLFSLIQPAVWLLFFGSGVGRAVDADIVGTDDYLAFVLPGIIAFTVVTNSVNGGMSLLWDKEGGYLDKLLAMPIARSSVIVSCFVFQVSVITAQVVLVMAVALAMGVDIAAGIPGVVAMLLAAAMLTLAITSLVAALVYRVPEHGTFFAITGFVTLPTLFMSNAFVPLDAMPGWMEAIARVNPLTYAIDAMRTLVLDGWEMSAAGAIGISAVFAAGCLALGTYEFGRHTGERIH